jgi:glyoxylase I family protein
MTNETERYSLHHVAVQTRDWEESLRFYRDLMGMRVIAEFGDDQRRLCLLETGGGGHIELYGPSDSSPRERFSGRSDPYVHIAFGTRDTRAALERVRSAGFTVTVEPVELQAGPLRVVIAFFIGPNGETIELIEMIEAEADRS